ncbi:MAG: efflux RND transporter periplasmic adaptor subunit [Candidatus Aminicenantes bacterium]|jgi:RND family efflux transporter MFP subunit
MKIKKLFFLLVSASLILTAFTATQCSNPGSTENQTTKNESKEKKDKTPGSEDKETDAVPVQVTNPTVGDISSFLLFSSNIDSEKVVDVYPLTFGIIEKINFDEGQQVKKGDVLAVLDDREATINEKKAHLNYKKLKAEFERQKEIFQRQMLSKETFEKLQFNMETAKLEWEQAKLLLSYTRITSPISGVVTKRYIKIGNKINTSQLAFSVVQDKEKIAVVNIPEQEKDEIYLKQKAVVFSGSKEVPGFVKRISPAIDPESGTFKVTVDVNDEKGIFAVGQFVNVKIIKKIHKNVVLLTKDALIFDGGKVFIFVVDENNEALRKQVELGFEDGSRVEVVEGLAENERVVTAGKNSLKNKTLVRIVEPVTT